MPFLPIRHSRRRAWPAALLGAAVLSLAAMPTTAQWRRDREVTAERRGEVSATGARRITVSAGAGTLEIVGREGLQMVRAHGTARASDRDLLEEIGLEVRRDGDEVWVEMVRPERGRYREDTWQALDLVVEVPRSTALVVRDGSGELTIRNTGTLDLTDGSGGIDIDGVRGDVHIADGSGSMTVRNVTGTVIVDRDGSGGIDVAGVTGDLRVIEDGSGSIDARRIGGDFAVERDGSGGITYSEVRGNVRIPSKDRRYRYRRP